MATVSGPSGAITFTGLASGIDTSSIIAGLTALNNQRISELQAQKDQVTQEQSAFGGLKTKLLSVQAAVENLSRSISGALDARKVDVSDTTALAAAASTSAAAGTYQLTVKSLAQQEQLASQGFADPGTNVKQGTLTLQVGSGQATTVTIDSTNNTLQGLADAINAAGGDVQAAVINDGSATPYRLLLTAAKSGAANIIQVTNNLTSGTGAAIDPANTVVQSASDAQIAVGSGAGAVTVASATNHFDNVFPGVSIQVQQADPAKSVTLTVGRDASAATTAVQAFVDAYNGLVDAIASQDGYDTTTQKAGLFLGNQDVNDLQAALGRTLTAVVPGANPKVRSLSAVGITFDDQGHLQFDQSKLQDIYDGKVAGASADDVKRLFALSGSSSTPRVTFLVGGAATKPSGASPYRVDVTQAATRAVIEGGDLPDSSTVTAGNNTFSLKLDGRPSSVLSLAAGTYTRAQLAAAVQAAVNGDSLLAGSQVIADLDGNKLRLTSQRYGSNSGLTVGTGSAIASGLLGFSAGQTAAGQDVAGSYLVNGVAEAATGIGQIFSGNSGNANTDGLQVRVTLDPSQVVSGPEADLTVTRGLADQLDGVLNTYLDPGTGRLKTIDKQFTSQADDIDQAIARQNDLLQSKTDYLTQQFTAMEAAISQLNNLSQQLAAQFQVATATTSSQRKTA